MKILDILAWILLVVGGLNWGLVGVFEFNLVSTLFGSSPLLERIVYILVGLSAVYAIFQWKCAKDRCCK